LPNPKWDSVAIIVYTGSHTSQADQQLGLSLGISQYILKPQEPDVLIEIIEKFLKK
jgi:DNA-binding response OmpR family regulator